MNEETLFHLAREKPPGERAAFLDQAGGVERLASLFARQFVGSQPAQFLVHERQ